MWSTTSSMARRQLVDVLAVERRNVLRVQQLDDLVGDAVAGVLDFLDFGLRHRRVRILPEADLRLLRGLERVFARSCEQFVKLGWSRDER